MLDRHDSCLGRLLEGVSERCQMMPEPISSCSLIWPGSLPYIVVVAVKHSNKARKRIELVNLPCQKQPALTRPCKPGLSKTCLTLLRAIADCQCAAFDASMLTGCCKPAWGESPNCCSSATTNRTTVGVAETLDCLYPPGRPAVFSSFTSAQLDLHG